MTDSAYLAAKRFGRGTRLDPPAEGWSAQGAHEEAERRRQQRLAAFAGIVRRKEQWYRKALDGRDLLRKWAAEAQLEGEDLEACIRCVRTPCE
jgi:hypothetical protein